MGFESRRFLNNIVPDLRDNFRTEEPPLSLTQKFEDTGEYVHFIDSVFPHDTRKQLWEQLSTFKEGTHRARIKAGNLKQGTAHPHDYIIDKKREEISFYFIDPEHQLGKSKQKGMFPIRTGDIRPKVSSLIGIKMTSGSDMPEISTIRFRTETIEDTQKLKMEAQLQIARGMLKTGETPEILKGKEEEITFRMVIGEGSVLVESRYVNQEDLKKFIKGESSAKALEGKKDSFRAVMGQFIKYSKDGSFTLL
jgi:hypothetical protein